ncbi:cytochrome-c oxidase, cbb3-type subunit III [Advenella kashmirensis]
MSDFFSNSWSYYIATIALVGVAWCIWLLFTQRRWLKHETPQVDDTGHVWDIDLRELNNPVPRWWTIMYLGLCAIALGIMVLYPALGSYPGLLGFTAAKQVVADREEQAVRIKPLFEKFSSIPVPELAKNPEAHAIGKRLFLNNCAQCHGSDAKGSPNFPNLTDSDWLYGGTPEIIVKTITDGRHGVMAPLGAIVSAAQANEIANYVRSLSGLASDPTLLRAGEAGFKKVCFACHGMDAKGNQALGAPNLTDNVWLGSSSKDTIINTILHGRQGVMPAQKHNLSEDQIRMLAAYVWGLSNK